MSVSRPVDVVRDPEGFTDHSAWINKNFGVEALSPQEDDVFTGHNNTTIATSMVTSQNRSFSPIGRDQVTSSPRLGAEGVSNASISPEVPPIDTIPSRTNSRRPSWTGDSVGLFHDPHNPDAIEKSNSGGWSVDAGRDGEEVPGRVGRSDNAVETSNTWAKPNVSGGSGGDESFRRVNWQNNGAGVSSSPPNPAGNDALDQITAGLAYTSVGGMPSAGATKIPIRHARVDGVAKQQQDHQQQLPNPLISNGVSLEESGGFGQDMSMNPGMLPQAAAIAQQVAQTQLLSHVQGAAQGNATELPAPYPVNMAGQNTFGRNAGYNGINNNALGFAGGGVGGGDPAQLSAAMAAQHALQMNAAGLAAHGNTKVNHQQRRNDSRRASWNPSSTSGVDVGNSHLSGLPNMPSSHADLVQQQILNNRTLLATMQSGVSAADLARAALLNQVPLADDLSTARETIQQQQALLQRQQQQLLAQQHQQLQQQQLQLQQQQIQLQQQQHQQQHHQGHNPGNGGRGTRGNRRATWAPGMGSIPGGGPGGEKFKESKDKDVQKFQIDIEKINRGENTQTTLMIKNIPNKYTPKTLLTSIDEDFACKYDFFYLPMDFKNKCNMGYAFINVIDPLTIIDLYNRFHGKKWEKFNSQKICQITYGRIQGQQPLIAHFKNSNLLSQKDEEFRPIVFVNGEKVSLDASYAFNQKEGRRDRKSSSSAGGREEGDSAVLAAAKSSAESGSQASSRPSDAE